MKKHVFFHRLLLFIISVAMVFSVTSCSQQRKPIPTPTKSKEQQNKPPKELDQLSKAVEKMEKTLSDMYERNKKPLFIQQEEVKKQGKQGNQQSQGGQGQQDQKQSGGSSSGGSSSGQQQSQIKQPSMLELITPEVLKKEPQLETKQMEIEVERAKQTQFEKLKKDVVELHTLWNAFEAKAVSQYLIQASIKDFEDALNNLTKSVASDDIYKSLLDVTQLYKYLPDFYSAYTAESPPEIGKIRFAAKKINLLSDKGDFDGAKEVLEYMSGIWMMTRPKLSQESKDMINQLEFASSDLKSAIQAKNNMIVKAKTEVILKVADELEKANGKKSQK